IGNFLTIIRNGFMVSKRSVVAPYSRMNEAIAKILLDEGFIQHIAIVDEEGPKKNLKVMLKYVDGESVIHGLDRKSKPSSRSYVKISNVKPVIGGLGLSILTTSRGVMSHKQAKQLRVGGEIICTVW